MLWPFTPGKDEDKERRQVRECIQDLLLSSRITDQAIRGLHKTLKEFKGKFEDSYAELLEFQSIVKCFIDNYKEEQGNLKGLINDMTIEFQTLAAQVQANTDVEASAVQVISGISKKLDDALAAGDTAGMLDLASKLKASIAPLAAAVAANTAPAGAPA